MPPSKSFSPASTRMYGYSIKGTSLQARHSNLTIEITIETRVCMPGIKCLKSSLLTTTNKTIPYSVNLSAVTFQGHYFERWGSVCDKHFFQKMFYPQSVVWTRNVSIANLRTGFTLFLSGKMYKLRVVTPVEIYLNLTSCWGSKAPPYFSRLTQVAFHREPERNAHCSKDIVRQAFSSHINCSKFIADMETIIPYQSSTQKYIQKSMLYFMKCLNMATLTQEKASDGQMVCRKTKQEKRFFSWLDTFHECTKMNTRLPTFLSRRSQEEFIMSVYTYFQLFPMQAVYIGLKNFNQVSIPWTAVCFQHWLKEANLHVQQLYRIWNKKGFTIHINLEQETWECCETDAEDTTKENVSFCQLETLSFEPSK